MRKAAPEWDGAPLFSGLIEQAEKRYNLISYLPYRIRRSATGGCSIAYLLFIVEILAGLGLAVWIIQRKGLLVEGSWGKIGASFLVFVVLGLTVLSAAAQVTQSGGLLYLAALGIPVALVIGLGSKSSWAIPFLVTGCVYGAVLLQTILLAGLQGL